MAKFTKEEKVEAVKRYRGGDESIETIANSIQVHHSNLKNWIKQYEHHGEKAFDKSYTSYSKQYKLDVLHYMIGNGTSIRETAAIFNIPAPSIILGWKRKVEIEGLDALESNKKGRPSMKKETKKPTPAEGSLEALQAELERLRMENTYLKKLNALVQEKEKLQNKTKRKSSLS